MSTEIIEGTVEHITYQNENNGYTVCDVSSDNALICAVGCMPSLACGEDILFPTNELRYMKPEEKTLYVSDLPQFETSPIFYLNYETRTFKAEAKSGTGFYFTLCGSFEETDGNLTLLVDGFEHFQGTSHLDITMVYEPLEANKYWYLLKKTKNGYLYSAEGSSPYVTTATSVKDGLGFEWKDGTVFVKSIAAWNDQ